MKTYTIKKIQGMPDWTNIPVMPIDTLLWTDSIDITAQAQICWDDTALYLRMEAVEPHIRAELTGPMASVCQDSCLEFFFRPTERPDYFNVEMNPNRAIWLGFGTCIKDLIRLQVPNVEKLFDSKVEYTDKGWVLTYQIPFTFIRRFFPEFEAKVGGKMYANAYKCGDSTVKPHYLAWNPIGGTKPSFHLPEYFGELIFGK